MATVLEPKLHGENGEVSFEIRPPVRPQRPMTKDFQLRFSAVILGLVIAIPLGLALITLLVYLWTVLSFAPPLIVLERLGVFPAMRRSVRLVR